MRESARQDLTSEILTTMATGYRIVESEDDCPAGMKMFYPSRE